MDYLNIKARRTQIGFNLIELMVTVTIVAIVTSISIPSFVDLIARNMVATKANSLFESLYIARNTAITQQKNVQICRMDKPNSLQCHTRRDYNAVWSNGWLIFADTNNSNEYDDGDNLIKVYQATEKVNIVFNQRGRLRFFPDGSARSAGFYVCDKQQQVYRHIYLLYSGRARVNETLTDQQRTICDSG